MSMGEWLWVIRFVAVLVFLICLAGNIRAAHFVGRIARKENRPISKSFMFSLNILLAGAMLAMVLAFRSRPPLDIENVVLSLARHVIWATLALKTIITEEIIIRRPERLFRPSEQQKIAENHGVTREQVDAILREFMR